MRFCYHILSFPCTYLIPIYPLKISLSPLHVLLKYYFVQERQQLMNVFNIWASKLSILTTFTESHFIFFTDYYIILLQFFIYVYVFLICLQCLLLKFSTKKDTLISSGDTISYFISFKKLSSPWHLVEIYWPILKVLVEFSGRILLNYFTWEWMLYTAWHCFRAMLILLLVLTS